MASKAFLMIGIAISTIALVTSPAMAKKKRHKAVDAQIEQTRELNQAQLESIQRAKAGAAAAQPAAAQSMPGDERARVDTSESANADQRKPDNDKLPDIQGAADEADTQQQGGSSTAMRTPATTAASGRSMALTDVANPKQTLARASVETKDGQKIGEVAQVETDASGKASAVMMTAQGNRNVRLDARQLTFMPDRGVLVSEVTPTDLNGQTPATRAAPSGPQTPTTPQTPAAPQTPETPPTAPPPTQ